MRRRWDELVLRYIPPKRVELVIRFAVRRRLVVRRPELLGERVEPSGHSHVVSVECVTTKRREVGEVCVAAASHRAAPQVARAGAETRSDPSRYGQFVGRAR